MFFTYILANVRKKFTNLVPRAGLEPARPIGHQILSLTCLPIPPPRHSSLAIKR